MQAPRGRLTELGLLFSRLGLTAFGGPASHVAMMEDEVVRRRGWLTTERFLDLFGVASLIPGPSSSELSISIGYERAGLPGLLVAGLCFILPAAGLTGALAWGYVRFGALPKAHSAFYGIKPVVIALVAQAIASLVPKAIKSRGLAAVLLGAIAASALSVNPLAILLSAGALAVAARWVKRAPGEGGALGVVWLAPFGFSGAAGSVTLLGIFGFFLKMGAVVFGSGYVLLAFLRADLVDRFHWLTESQLLDAVAVGQITPGPVFTTATFIGYLLGGVPGAIVATIGIFLPAFVLVALTRPLLVRLRQSALAGAFLDGVNVASFALMAVVTAQLGRAALVDGVTIAIALVAGMLLLKWKTNSAWLVLGGAVAGVVTQWFG